MSAKITSLDDIFKQVKTPQSISLDCSLVSKGIDNYHTDVEISAAFTLRVKETIEQNLKRLINGRAMLSGNAEVMIELRDVYTDLMKVTLHRSKTDLTRGEIQILQFALVKFIIQEVRDALDRYGAQLEEMLGQQQYAGSRNLMTTQEKIGWFRKHSAEFQFRLIRLYLRQLQREENNHIKALRTQVLGGELSEAANLLYNPLLFGRGPRDPLLLLDYYALWPGNGSDFEKVNDAIEATIAKNLPELKFEPLKASDKLGSAQSEVYDELGGLFAAQTIMGPSEDQGEKVTESFCWLDHPGNVRLLFDEQLHERNLANAKDDLGFSAKRGLKGDIKKLLKVASDIRKTVGDNRAVMLILAGYAVREKLQQPDLDLIDIDKAIELIANQDIRKIGDALDRSQEGAAVLQAKLEECSKHFDEVIKNASDEMWVKFLTDYCRYRLHLKYYRFAHRMFNRVSVITDPEKIQLAKAGGNLYRLLTGDEVKEVVQDEGPEIVHHTILKADVRGSTTVTAELMNKGLNPASYFSLRFFNPINERLATYGSVKVFIEGDAVILGHYEYDNAPEEWFSVSRACGIAKEMLDIVASKNAHSRQEGLPLLEIGIGICYSDERPLFLFDENRPIMISSAIGDADRMSGCSWKLRGSYDPGNFNIGVMQIAEGERQKGEKGQELIRYNVNGIVIDDAAMAKLSKEVHFKTLKARSGDHSETFHVGQYPDVQGKLRDIVVHEGRVGTWSETAIDRETDTGLKFYEVLPNSKFSAQIVELARKKAS